MGIDLRVGDCLEVMRGLAENSVDAVVTDPPYGLSFMSKKWDYDVPSVEIWKEVFRVLKPGGHLLAFGGTRTYHRLAVNIEDAGFEIRDQIQWLQGQGFPKSLDVRKAAIKAGLACECNQISEHQVRSLREANLSQTVDTKDECRQVLQSSVSQQDAHKGRMQGGAALRPEESVLAGRQLCGASEGLSADSNAGTSQGSEEWLCSGTHSSSRKDVRQTTQEIGSSASHQSQAERQPPEEFEGLLQSQRALDGTPLPRCSKCQRSIFPEGLGSALKPANEPVCVARKPLEKGLTVAQNVQKWGTGAINIDGCRIDGGERPHIERRNDKSLDGDVYGSGINGSKSLGTFTAGRFPANVILDEEAGLILDEQTGELAKQGSPKKKNTGDSAAFGGGEPSTFFGDKGGASRFFYVAKASTRERNRGLEGMPDRLFAQSGGAQKAIDRGETEYHTETQSGYDTIKRVKNFHPTVKPVKLMEYLCRLITPPGGIVLDPFMGSGTTGIAAKRLGVGFIGIELSPEYFSIASQRINSWVLDRQIEIGS